MSISGGQRLRRSDVRRERKELLLSVERGNKADIQTYSSGHLGPRGLNPMHVHCQRDKPIWRGSVYTELKLSGPSRFQESQVMDTNVEEMVDTMSNFTMATTLQEPEEPSSTGSPDTPSWPTSVDPYKTREVLDTTELFLVKPSKQRACAPAEEVDQGRYWCTHSYLAGLTHSDQLQQWKLFDQQVVKKQDLMTRNSLREAAQRHEHKLQQALRRVPVCRGLCRERLRAFSDVFSDVCDGLPALGSILREIKMGYDLYLNSAISSESSFQDMSALMPLEALSGTAELEDATRQVSLMEEKARRALEENDRVRTKYDDARNQKEATGNQKGEASEQAISPDVKHTETEGSSMAQVMCKRQQVWKMWKEMQSLQKEIRDTMVSTVTTSSLEGCLRDTKAEIMHLISRNKQLRSTNKDLEQNILKVLHRAKVSEETKAEVCEKIWTTMNADY